jgi:hypothetical protein
VRAALFCIIALAGCSTDPCDPYSTHTCIALEVKGTPSVDQLAVTVDMVLPRQLTPDPARADALPLPVWVAILPGEAFPTDKPLRIFVDALRNGSLVGQALGELTMRPGDHVSAAITLTDLNAGADLSPGGF